MFKAVAAGLLFLAVQGCDTGKGCDRKGCAPSPPKPTGCFTPPKPQPVPCGISVPDVPRVPTPICVQEPNYCLPDVKTPTIGCLPAPVKPIIKCPGVPDVPKICVPSVPCVPQVPTIPDCACDHKDRDRPQCKPVCGWWFDPSHESIIYSVCICNSASFDR